MAQICTTREQSKKLQELGISADTADMFYPLGSSFPEICDNRDNLQADYPAWSLGALIELMPDRLIYEDVEFKLSLNNKVVRYDKQGTNLTLSGCIGKNLFDNCVDMIEWLVNGEYINNEEMK